MVELLRRLQWTVVGVGVCRWVVDRFPRVVEVETARGRGTDHQEEDIGPTGPPREVPIETRPDPFRGRVGRRHGWGSQTSAQRDPAEAGHQRQSPHDDRGFVDRPLEIQWHREGIPRHVLSTNDGSHPRGPSKR